MYRIDSLYEPIIEGLTAALAEGREERWMASLCWYLGRQQIYSVPDYWLACAALLTKAQASADRDAIVAQLGRAEEALLDTVTAYPDRPQQLTYYLQSWQTTAAEPTPADLIERYSRAVQKLLDGKAKERQYDSIQSAISYMGDPNPLFAAEAAALRDWRSAVWTYATGELQAALDGSPVPTLETFLAGIPAFVWPAVTEA